MNKPHKHASLIKQWADGAKIEFYDDYNSEWVDCPRPEWNGFTEYRVKPEREYPKSSLSYNELCSFMTQATRFKDVNGTGEGVQTLALRFCADAAVKRYIQDVEETQ